MIKPKVLIVSPTYNKTKKYLYAWTEGIKAQTYTNYDILFCDNSNDGGEYAKELEEHGIVIKSEPDPVIHYALEKAYNKIRDYFLENQYDAMWIVEADQVPLPDALERLIEQDKLVVGCPYFLNKNNDIVCVHDYKTEQIYNWKEIELLMKDKTNKCLKVFGCGHGAVLAKRSVLERVAFRVESKIASPDTWWYVDLKKENIGVYCLTDCMSEHLRVTDRFSQIPEGTITFTFEEPTVVECSGDFWNSADWQHFFILRGQQKLLPRVISKITWDAIQQGLLRKVKPEDRKTIKDLMK